VLLDEKKSACCRTGKKSACCRRKKKCAVCSHAPTPNSAHPPLPGLFLHNLQYLCEAIMSQTYICPCSKCRGGSKAITKRTIELHLQQDRQFLQSLPSDADSAVFVKACVNQTTQLLSQLHRGPRLLDTALDVDGSHPEDPEGVFLSFLTPLTCAYLIM
jgi:hypothetical protein